jgi:[acyl-carrier-protein] S-malonyltransferase
MRALVAENRPDLLALSESLLGANPFERLDEGTTYLQPAIYCATLAGWSTVSNRVTPCAIAGHSLGEVAAAAIGGAISAEDGLRLTVSRGRACQRAADVRPGGMLAVKATLEHATALAAAYELTVANDNAPDQVVLAGDSMLLARLQSQAPTLGVTALALPTNVPFHTAAMRPAMELIGERLASMQVLPPRYPIFCAASAAPFTDIRRELASALVRPVLWRETALALIRYGVTCFLDLGPGRTLARLTRRTATSAVPVLTLKDVASDKSLLHSRCS